VGFSCLVGLPLLVLASLFTFWRLGRAIRPIAPALWDELRPEPGRGKAGS
jgi:hypothetical protein